MAMLEDFKKFAFKGNVIDLAVGVVIGAAFGGVVKSIVEALINPLIGKIVPGKSLESWSPGGIHVGVVISAVISFLAIALVLFVIVSAIQRAMKREQVIAPPPEPSDEAKLLAEIRDLLRRQQA